MRRPAAGAAAGLLLLLSTACAPDAAPPGIARVLVPTRAGETAVDVELAATPDSRARGLMFRDALAEGRGMLFVFDEEADHGFWMRNTRIPLDMIFVASDGRIVGVVEEAAPMTEETRRVGRPSRYVLEVPGGWCRRVGADTAGRVRFE